MAELWMFIGALVVVYLMPGPDMILLLETGAMRGRSHAIATAVGLAAARGCHVALAAIGLAALFRAAPWTFDLTRFASAAYLAVLGVRILWAGPQYSPNTNTPRAAIGLPRLVSARRGFLTNLLNPKALMFCSILLPQFVHADAGSFAAQFAVLGVILVAVGFAFDLVYAASGATLGRWIGRSPTLERIQRRLFAFLLIGFALRLALAPRPQ